MISKILIAGFCEKEPVCIEQEENKCKETKFQICSTITTENDKTVTEFYNFRAFDWLANDIYTRMKEGNNVFIEARLTSENQLIAMKLEWLMQRKPDQTRRL